MDPANFTDLVTEATGIFTAVAGLSMTILGFGIFYKMLRKLK